MSKSKDAIWKKLEFVTSKVILYQSIASVQLAANWCLRQWIAWTITTLNVRNEHVK